MRVVAQQSATGYVQFFSDPTGTPRSNSPYGSWGVWRAKVYEVLSSLSLSQYWRLGCGSFFFNAPKSHKAILYILVLCCIYSINSCWHLCCSFLHPECWVFEKINSCPARERLTHRPPFIIQLTIPSTVYYSQIEALAYFCIGSLDIEFPNW